MPSTLLPLTCELEKVGKWEAMPFLIKPCHAFGPRRLPVMLLSLIQLKHMGTTEWGQRHAR